MNQETTVVDLNDFNEWGVNPANPAVETSAADNNFLAKEDLSYLDKPDQITTEQTIIPEPTAETPLSKEQATEILNSLPNPDDIQPEVPEEQQVKRGKDALVDFIQENIESGDYINYNDYKEGDDLKSYLTKLPVEDLKNLHKQNLNRIRQEESSKGPEAFIQSLDPKIQAAIYYSQQGLDPTQYMQATYQLDNIKNANLEDESVQEYIVKQHLTNTQFGTPEQIDQEIQNIKDGGRLEDKSKQFHPHLVRLDEQRVQQLEQQAQYEQNQRAQQYQQYTEGVYKALEGSELAGIKLDRKTQESLYLGMIEPRYPDRFGNPTTELGSLLDRIQYTDPNYALLAEVTLMLRNPEEYREKIRQQGANKNTETVVRQLKTEQNRQLQPQEQTPVTNTRQQRPAIQRNTGFFTRPSK